MRIVAVDWSGRLKGAEEFIWLAEVLDGQLVSLENGRSREQLVDYLVASAKDQPRTVVGLDFAFSFPQWWCAEQGWPDGPAVWAAMAADGERLLDECQPPFWGRPGAPNPHPEARRYRQTELADGARPKSVFQIGGAGAVGTGSIRGMPHLRTLALAGFDVWPFGPGRWPRVVEIYPRALTGPVNKRRWQARNEYLSTRYPSQPPELLERASGSEDAFDATVSALVMERHSTQLSALAPASAPGPAVEGEIWRPR